MSYMGRPNDLIIEEVEAIANALAGEEETAYDGPSDRLRHALHRIAEHFASQNESEKDQSGS